VDKEALRSHQAIRQEEIAVMQRQQDEIVDLFHLLADTAKVIIADVANVIVLLVLALDCVTLGVDDSVGGNLLRVNQ